jgi:single-stranded-DNA-specific exonuclease
MYPTVDQEGNTFNWQKPSAFTPTEEQKNLAQIFKVDPFIIHLLNLRNISTRAAIAMFLNPNLANLPDPFTMKGMNEAVSLIVDAINGRREIVVWGDYDVDGVTSTCLLVNFFKQIEKTIRWYIPDRFTEGYGLNCKGISAIRADIKTSSPILITVDCGISNHIEVRLARDLGFTIIITDHHQPPEIQVEADAILNVKQYDCAFKDKNLAGVGTAFYLAAGIRSRLKTEGYFRDVNAIPNLKQFLDLVAIGTISDMVPITGINRILTKAGFEILADSANIGVSAIFQSSDIVDGIITSDDIAFQVGPKINAAGRMDNAKTAMDLLLCEEMNKAPILAKELSDLNSKRKKVCNEIVEYSLNIDPKALIYGNNCIIITDNFHQGVIGIVASRLAEKYNLPVIVFTEDSPLKEKTVLKGSGRSVAGIDLIHILSQCERFLIKFGGHAMAAGMSILPENIEKFKRRFSETLDQNITETQKKYKYYIDAELPIERFFEDDFTDQLYKFEPYGEGNRKPIFLDPKATILDSRIIGRNGEHLKVYFRCKYSNHQGIGFNLGNRKNILNNKTTCSVIYSPTLNRFNNSANWEIRLFDIF